ncbi:hypothetical protein NC651_020953 [Populus alba x Populus x berolinensis]|nr:hypothetical protein NC651_020953 [Populus alba x Populus x berolinensis]
MLTLLIKKKRISRGSDQLSGRGYPNRTFTKPSPIVETTLIIVNFIHDHVTVKRIITITSSLISTQVIKQRVGGTMVNAISTTKGRKLVDKQTVYFVFLIKTRNLLASQQNDLETLSILQFRFYLFSLAEFTLEELDSRKHLLNLQSDPDEAAAILPMGILKTRSLLDIRIKKGTDVEEAAKTLHPCWVAYRICDKILKPCSLNNYDGLAVHHGQQSFLTIFLLLLGEFQDPTRNPAVEEQAMMRIHWIGQKHTVSVRRFIVKVRFFS